MPDHARLDDFIATVVAGRYDEAIERFYAPQATMQENVDEPRKGRDGLVAHERAVMAAFRSIRATCPAPAFVNGEQVVIRWIFEFEHADGRKMRLDELAHQRWEGGSIAEERFYYDPRQLQA